MFVTTDNPISATEIRSGPSPKTQAIAVAAVSLLLLALILWGYNRDIHNLKEEFQTIAHVNAAAVAETITQRMEHLHRGLQTIANLHTVRSSYQQATGIDPQTTQTLEEIYSFLHTFIELSEIYITPRNFDPNLYASGISNAAAPIITFDQEQHNHRQFRVGDGAMPEEIEYYEHLEIRQHLNWFNANYTTTDRLLGQQYPAQISREVITGDNSRYFPGATDNRYRLGLVYSVPFYNLDGELAGTISGIFLNDALRDLLPSSSYAIRNTLRDFTILGGKDELRLSPSYPWVFKGQADPGLIYSENITLPLANDMGTWNLWVGLADADFWQQKEILAAKMFSLLTGLTTILLGLGLASIVVIQARQRRLTEHQNVILEERVRDRTAALQESEALANVVLENAADGILVLNRQGQIETFNKGAEKLFGYSTADVKNTPIHKLIPDFPIHFIDGKTSGATHLHNELTGLRMDASEFALELHISELRLTTHTVYTGFCRDISDRKAAEYALYRAKEQAELATQAKSDFLANMSHELRTPLNAIIGYTELLQDEALQNQHSQYQQDITRILSAGQQLLHQVNGILDLSKIEAGKMELFLERFMVNELIREVLDTASPLIKQNKNQVEVQLCPNDCAMEADRTKLRQILLNLLSNAAKFTKQGIIKISAVTQLEYGLNWLSLAIADSGIGMNKEQQSRIFQIFTQGDSSTTKEYGGTGLGLTISKHFCEMMGGGISVESRSGSGSTFTVRLPLLIIGPKVDPVLIRFPEDPSLQHSRRVKISRVLIISNSRLSQDLLDRFLSREGFFTDVSRDVPQALTLAIQNTPDIIVVDENTLSYDSWREINQLKNTPHLATVPIVLLTKSDSVELTRALGADDFLNKPIQRSDVINIVKRHLRDIEHGSASRQHILVIDDQLHNRTLLEKILEKEGLAVVSAENGKVGLECMANCEPALIFLDIMMPVMDGFEFAEKLRENPAWRKIPIISVTAFDLTAEQRLRLCRSVDTIISKEDLEPALLMEKMRNALVTHLRQQR